MPRCVRESRRRSGLEPPAGARSFDLARRCRAAGVTVPATDVLIDACARRHGAALEQADADFDRIAKAAPRAADRATTRDVTRSGA
jgi:predicted nucleic acid-binding protein